MTKLVLNDGKNSPQPQHWQDWQIVVDRGVIMVAAVETVINSYLFVYNNTDSNELAPLLYFCCT